MDATDKKLLESAAKAAGIDVYWWPTDDPVLLKLAATNDQWNPLTSDSDALRLAVKLRFDISQLTMDGQQVLRVLGPLSIDKTFEIAEDDPYAATRRAIVRAAAAIGAAS